MIRRFNYTGRRKLPTSCASIHLFRKQDAPSDFQAELRLEEHRLPSDAQVYVEAYYRSSMMRFSFGNVTDAIKYAGERFVLTDIQNSLAFFRVKIVDETADIGRIVAIVDRIKPVLPEESDAANASLLFVEYVDLGDRIWRIDIADDYAMPILQVNSGLNIETPVQEFVRYHPSFMSLVYPAAVQEVLDYILRDETLPEDEEESWKTQWLQFGAALQGEKSLPNFYEMLQGERRDWIDGVVMAFCSRNEIKQKLEQGSGTE